MSADRVRYPPSVDREDVVTAAHAVGLGEWAEALAREARPSIRLVLGHDADGADDSRLGGIPALPAGYPWPTSHGAPQAFIGQIRLDALGDTAGFGLPADGMLSFFFDAEQRLWSPDPEHSGEWQVAWFPPGTPLELREPPAGLDPAARFDGRSLSAAREWTVPSLDTPEMDRIALPEAFGRGVEVASEGFEALQERLSASPGDPRHRMFGFADQIQSDVRWEAEVDTARVERGPAASVPYSYDTAVPAPDWQLLLQVDSDESLGMQWGDVGTLYFLVRPEVLQERTFERTWLVAQCY
jgi:uncharacterized protein YwqG